MANKYINKIIIGTEVKLDLSSDTITPDKLAEGVRGARCIRRADHGKLHKGR